MYLNISSFGIKRMTRTKNPTDYLSTLLGECGYRIFKIDPKRQRRHCDHMMIVLPNKPSSAMWLYRKANGTIVVRPWTSSQSYERLKERLAAKSSQKIDLKKGGLLKLRKAEDTWVSWLSEASKREAKELGLV